MKRSQLVFLFAVGLFATSLAAQVNDTYIIAAAARAPGALGTQWQTQFSLFNPQSYGLKVSVTFLPTGGGAGLEALIDVPANSTVLSDNIMKDLGVSGTGALLAATFPEDNPGVPNDTLSRSFLVTSNTFNNAGGAGTFGQTIPGVWAGLQDYKTDGISAVAHGIRNKASLGWRANVGGVNLGRSNVTMRVTVYDANGNTLIKDAPLDLPPLGHRQASLPVEVNGGSVEFFVDDPSKTAVVFAYSSVIDNLSGDPTYQSPTLLASPQLLFSMAKRGIDATNIGKKIDTSVARAVRENASRIGMVQLTAKGITE
jgi:hypothetical protein